MTTTILGVRSTVWMTLFAIVMFAFVSYRAWNTSFTHDECYSFMYYPRDSVIDILLYKEPFTNNHILNSLGMKWSEEVFGNSEFSLRIPNLLALLLFFIYCILLFRRLPILIAIPGFLLMNSNSFLMEMFSIARGYGLSFGFLMMGIYHLSKAGSKSLSIHIILFHFAGLLASLSNFVLLGTYVSMILTHMIFLGRAKVIDPAISLRNSFILSLLLGCISASVMYTPIIRMLEFNDLDFGGRTNFFDSTMWTWIFSWFHPIVISARVTLLIQIAITMIILASVVLTIRKLSIRNYPSPENGIHFETTSLVLALTWLGIEVQHLLFNVDYPQSRFSLFMLPLFILILLETLNTAHGRFSLIVTRSFIGIAAALSFGVFIYEYGPQKSIEWQYDLCTNEAMTLVRNDAREHLHNGNPIKVGNTWQLEPSINYYRMVTDLPLTRADREGITNMDGYRYVLAADIDANEFENYITLASFNTCGTVLYRRIGLYDSE